MAIYPHGIAMANGGHPKKGSSLSMKPVDQFFKMKLLTLALFLTACLPVRALDYYSTTNGGLWTNPATWSTVTYGNATNTGTYPQAGDNVYIGNGYVVLFNTNTNIANLFVGQGTSGELRYYNLAIYWLRVTGNVTVYNGAKLDYTSNSSLTHQLYIEGNLTNNGEVDLYQDANDLVNLSFEGTSHSVVSGVGAWDLNVVTMNKNTSKTWSLEIQTYNFETAWRSYSLAYGTFIHNNSGTLNISTSSDYTLPANINIDARDGIINFVPNSSYVYLQGGLYVSGGTVNIASAAHVGGIYYDQANVSVVPFLEVSAGTLTVYGAVTFKAASFNEPFGFRMTGGNILLNCATATAPAEVFYITDKAASSFTMSGGTLTFQKSTIGGTNVVDFTICGAAGTVNVTGGVVQFGNASTPANTTFNFKPFPSVTLPAFRISGPSTNGTTLMPSKSSTANVWILGLEIQAGGTYDIRSISGIPSTSRTTSLRGTISGSNAFINNGTLSAQSGTFSLDGTSAQDIAGSVMPVFYNFTMNNSAGSTLYNSIYVYNTLTMTTGKINTSYTYLLNLGSSGSTTIGNSNSFVVGPMNKVFKQMAAAALNFPIGKGNNWRPMVLTPSHTTNDSVNYISEVIESPASAFGYTLPASLSSVSNVRYWLVTNTKSSVFNNATIQLYYGADDGVTDKANLRVAEGISPNWYNRNGTGTANGTGSITSTSFSAWGNVFTLANATGGVNTLPIELVSFSANQAGDEVKIDWTTASEINNDYFTVERSVDGLEYTGILTLPGAGNSSGFREYHAVDRNPVNGISYYRLRQTDFDGVTETFDPVKVEFNKRYNLSVFPNPVVGNDLNIHMENFDVERVQIVLKRADGAVVLDRTMNGREFDGSLRLQDLDLPRNGLFILTLTADGEVYQQKLITLAH